MSQPRVVKKLLNANFFGLKPIWQLVLEIVCCNLKLQIKSFTCVLFLLILINQFVYTI